MAKVKNVVDGDFDSVPSAKPFNWSQDTARFSVQDSSAYGRSGPALRLSYDGMGSSSILGQQLLVLPAGHYRLSGDVLTANTGSAGAIAWKVVCTDTTETPIATAPAPATGGGWKRFSVDFDVTEACPAQWLRAMTTPNGTPVTIEVWYDKIAIDRLDQTS